jgi:hypothetical protein
VLREASVGNPANSLCKQQHMLCGFFLVAENKIKVLKKE